MRISLTMKQISTIIYMRGLREDFLMASKKTSAQKPQQNTVRSLSEDLSDPAVRLAKEEHQLMREYYPVG